MHRTLAVALLVTTILMSPAFAHDDAPYIGVWDCGVGVFTFTAQSYNPGDAPMQIRSIEGSDGTYTMTFDDGYQIGVSMNGEDAMGWLSMASGDAFDCKRLYD